MATRCPSAPVVEQWYMEGRIHLPQLEICTKIFIFYLNRFSDLRQNLEFIFSYYPSPPLPQQVLYIYLYHLYIYIYHL